MKKIENLSVPALHLFLNRLPQELYEEIYNLVFTAPAGPINLTVRFNPIIHLSLKLLRIDSNSRKKYAASYYSREFTFHAKWLMDSIQPFIRWTRSIDSCHLAFLTKVTLVRNNNRGLTDNDYLAWIVESCRRSVAAGLGHEVMRKVVYELSDGR
ncbi:uncharacterized protein RCC_01252 [Ramularia collo-cygni]|uniref:Uncharacterized protein n=1 Tax=Ramularia collo-cygni TaxID=112498 RepID=A0A2D3UNZ7_9PEZI|nr:uncharacterized protein RCC_01252 [Ramularia collo-cygni]CZT15388.1 uncharacterized protein RCC_01252 [Ramularia collo-cygni]